MRDGRGQSDTAPPRVLVADDETKIRRIVCEALAEDGVECLTAATGEECLALVAAERPDLLVLDLGLPDLDGVEVCGRIREWSTLPIVVLSARHSEAEKTALLDVGADDYVTKPFAPLEFRARVRAQLRRSRMRPVPAGDAPLVVGPLTIDAARRTVLRDGTPIHLTPIEWSLLSSLVTNAPRIMTHRQLFTAVWGNSYGDAQQYLRVYIAHLRKKLEIDPYDPRHILTEPGVGYRFEPDA